VKCIRCGRALDIPTVQIRTRAGLAAWGPKCARKAGLLPERMTTTRAASKTAPARRRTADDENQMQLELTV
jgi:hypothetical protein